MTQSIANCCSGISSCCIFVKENASLHIFLVAQMIFSYEIINNQMDFKDHQHESVGNIGLPGFDPGSPGFECVGVHTAE